MTTEDLTLEPWEVDSTEFPTDGSVEQQAQFLLRYAILAPSSHNSQPWEFVVDGPSVDGPSIEVHAAEDRWLDVADQDRRELYVSIGCAIENLCIAAEHFDLGFELDYHDTATPVATITLRRAGDQASERPPALFDELTERYTNHQLFDGRPLPEDVRAQMHAVVAEDDVRLLVVDEADRTESIAELQAEADRRQMADPAYRKELAHWVGIGALGDSWLKARIGQAVVTYLDLGDREAQKNSKLVTSAAAVGVLLTDSDDSTARVRTGQVFERLALAAAARGVAVHPLSQILERPDMRDALGDVLDGNVGRPQHLFRLGYPVDEQGHTPRWPLAAFLAD